ncbi:MAG TPA: NADH-ubiquinone oxidoreductase-F iron-sulfur binding region domain-containing protein [Acidimicrobiales bacterium]|nr:NADH-ubiquinone oxidoreductase-F iron-sulfur binding region domain-containing protein [Acidimicrobiales bacterium]
MSERFLLPDQPLATLDDWRLLGGGEALSLAQDLGPSRTIEEITASGLRGRGGGGFSTGRKWAGVLAQPGTHRYAVCNGAEGEPATFKDRALLRGNPYQLVEGLAVAALTIGAREAFVGVKARFEPEIDALSRAVDEMEAAGLTAGVTITIVPGPDQYLFGEEKALLEVIEGHAPLPRLFPPFEHGLFATAPQTGWESHEPEPGHHGAHLSNPTLVNNVETLCNVPHILMRGAQWHRGLGTSESPGNVVVTVVGDVARPGVAEVELGTPLGDVIETVGGGPRSGHRVKAVFSGVANAVVTADDLDAPLSYEGLAAVGSGMGAAGFAVYDETACMVEVARQYSRFLYVESCGQCPACKLGTGEITDRLAVIEACAGSDEDIAVIGARLPRVTDGNRCYLPVEEQLVVSSILREFPEEFAAHLEGDCPRPRDDLLAPKIVDLSDGQVVYDERHRRKLPDWTYEGEPASSGD